MIKSLIGKGLRQFGYRLSRIQKNDFQPNPRIDEQDFAKSLAIIKRATQNSSDSMTWERSRRYFNSARVNFYYGVLEVLEEANLLGKDARVLDVGVYFGYMLRILHKFHPQSNYFGTETHETRIAIAKELCPWATLWHSTIDELDPTQRYGVALLTEVLEHMVRPADAVNKLARIADVLLLTVPDGRQDTTEAMQFNAEWGSYRGHVNFWSPESWQYWLEKELPNHFIRTGILPTRKLYALVQQKS